MATINLVNRESYAVLVYINPTTLQQEETDMTTSLDGRRQKMTSLLVDGKSTRQASVTFPRGVSVMLVTAYRLDRQLMVNGRYAQELRPGNAGQSVYAVIREPGNLFKEFKFKLFLKNQ